MAGKKVKDNIPKSVKEEGEAAQQQIKEMAGKRQKPPQSAGKPTPPPEPTAGSAPEPQPQPEPVPQAPTPAAPAPEPVAAPSAPGQTPPQAPAAPAPAAPVPQTQATPEQLKTENEGLRHQLASVNGRHGQQLSELKSQLTILQQQIARAPVAPQAAPVVPPPSAPVLTQPVAPVAPGVPAYLKHVPKEDIDRYGEEYYKNAALASKGQYEELEAQKTGRVQEEVATQLKAIQAAQADAAFWSDAERLEPGTMAIQGDKDAGIPPMDGFADYLNQPIVPGSPLTIRAEAQAAYNGSDVTAFARIVGGFKRSRPDLFTPKETVPRPTIAAQTVPASTPAGAPAVGPDSGLPGSKRQIPQSEITRFTQLVGAGKAGDEATIASKLAEYHQALAEGRIIQA